MMEPAGSSFGVIDMVRLVLSALFITGVMSAQSVIADSPRVFRVGAYAADITPTSFPVSSAGSMTPRSADAAHDRLHARCFVFDDGDTTVAIAIVDSCMIPRAVFDAAKQAASDATGVPTSHMLMSATHTHSAVTAARTFQSKVETAYTEFLTQRIAEGIVEAHSRLQPARIGWAVGNNPNQVFNRRWFMREGFALTDPFDRGSDRVRMNPPRNSPQSLKPAGQVDPEVPIIAAQSLDGVPIAALANYSLHYVGNTPPNALSADYFGEFARVLSHKVVGRSTTPFVAAMSNGTSGDINNINFFEHTESAEPFEQIRVVAEDVGEAAHHAFQRVAYEAWVPLRMKEVEIELGVRKPSDDDIGFANRVLAEAGEPPYRDRRAIYALETLDLAEYPETVSVKLQALSIGGLAIVTTPCETFVETGLAIKRQSPFQPTFTIELANGYNGYLPPRGQHALGGYETWRAKSSYLAVDAEEKIRETLLAMLNELSQEAESARDSRKPSSE